MSESPIFIDHLGEERRLGLIPPDEAALEHRKLCSSFTEYCAEKGVKLIPESEWKDVIRSHFDGRFNLNQKQTSGCVGYSDAAAEMKQRYSIGLPLERLSGAFSYDHINGGRDAGAMITDSMRASAKNGYCLESEYPTPRFNVNQIPELTKKSALTRQPRKAYTISSDEELFSAIMLGLFPQFGINVGGNFNNFRNGVAGWNGGYANHSVHGCGMKKINGVWCLEIDNTWGTAWGPFGNGHCYIDRRAIRAEDAYVRVDSEIN